MENNYDEELAKIVCKGICVDALEKSTTAALLDNEPLVIIRSYIKGIEDAYTKLKATEKKIIELVEVYDG